MGTETGIEWCHHTFNAWRGCTKVSDGCKFCYADRDSKRNPKVLGVWGPNGTRVIAAEAYWQQPIKWNQAAREAGERRHVFCASLADVYEGRDTMPEPSWGPVEAAGKRLLKVIHRTPWLDWLLLTKRPQNIMSLTQAALDPEDLTVAGDPVGDGLLSASFKELFPTVWLGTSVENQEAVLRVHELMKVRAAVWFISAEPLLGHVQLPEEFLAPTFADDDPRTQRWVIVGGESGSQARPMHPVWAESIRDQCVAAGVPFFFKQNGEFRTTTLEEAEADDPRIVTIKETEDHDDCDRWPVTRVGKRVAGRMLDGREWSEFPRPRAEAAHV